LNIFDNQKRSISGLNIILTLNTPEKDSRSFWNQNHFILIYHYSEDQDKFRMYYTDIIGGETLREYKLLKNLISSTHSTIINNKFAGGDNIFGELTIIGFSKSELFINDTGIIKNFELLLEHDGKSLFECSLEYILNTKINEVQYGYSGYKIENSHFKLGSKIHIKDFIYAKRIFQNSFFTDRLAFIMAKHIIEKYNLKPSITIIGYGDYSKMLINRIEKILSVYLNSNQINHDMISDAEKPAFIKNVELHNNILVIVPIVTTFSTTIKIENLIKIRINTYQKLIHVNLLTPSLNIILVSHHDLNDINYVESLNKYLLTDMPTNNALYPYKFFYWKNINTEDKIVTVGTNPIWGGLQTQEYFLAIKSEWYLPEKCDYCFPEWNLLDPSSVFGILQETPLLETDKTSVTPDLLLDLPTTFEDDTSFISNNIYVTKECHQSKHILYRGNHYYHFIEPLPFFNIYKMEIIKWAENIKLNLFKIIPELFNSSILLISPSDRNNTYFVELINSTIFNDAAIIINYEISGDYTENYQKFFSGNIKQSDYIFYVDDIVQSGKTFQLVNDFVRFCNNQGGFETKDKTKNKSCDGIFALISKTDKYSKHNIVSQIYNNVKLLDSYQFNVFHNLCLNYITIDKCPLCKEQNKYNYLADNSILDTIKHYFLNKANNLEIERLDNKLQIKNDWAKYNPLVSESSVLPWKKGSSTSVKYLYNHFINIELPSRNNIKLLLQHELNLLFSNNTTVRNLILFEFNNLNNIDKIEHVTRLFDSISNAIKSRNPFSVWYENYNELVLNIYDDILNELIIKVITAPPFSNIKCINDKTFYYLNFSLNSALDEFIFNKKLDFLKFRKIKFLMRRITQLGGNYIIRKQALLKLREIYQLYPKNIKLEKERKRGEKLDYLYMEFNNLLVKKNNLRKLEIEKNTAIGLANLIDVYDYDSKIKKLNKMLQFINNKIEYISQAIENIKYIDVSLQEFSYFFVALVKEVTTRSDYKVLKLEQNIDQIYSIINVEQEQDFYFLLQVLKYENVFLVKNALEIIFNDFLSDSKILYFNNRFRSLAVRKLLDETFTKALEDYRLNAFRQYFNIENVEVWKNQNKSKFLHLMELLYIYSCLINENSEEYPKPINIKLEDKTKSILQNFYRIASDNNFERHIINENSDITYNDTQDNGAFLVIKYIQNQDKIIEPNHLIVAYATKPYNVEGDYEILNAPFDNNSLSFLMINGINNRNERVFAKYSEQNGKAGNSSLRQSFEIDKRFPKKTLDIMGN